jgi:hypothetical protein
MTIPLLYPFRYSEDEAAVVEAAWIAVFVVVAAASAAGGEATEVETFSLSVHVVGVFAETILPSPRLRFVFHPSCL